MTISQDFQAHLDSGVTTLAHAWAITRTDGTRYGFTDHDRALVFDGLEFRPDSGLSALALQQSTGLSVDNTEAMGALTDAALTEADIEAGRYDGAEVIAWRVNWADVSQRTALFRGTIGEIRRGDGAFHAEIRGLSALLNRPLGRVYQKPCTAVLGDAACGVDLDAPGYATDAFPQAIEGRRTFYFAPLGGFDVEWFKRGSLEVLSGAAQGLRGAIKRDETLDGQRVIELWEPLRAEIVAGDPVRLRAGCDKRFETCRLKFANALNFQGFPDIPEEDWVMLHPSRAANLSGGSRR